MSLTSRRPFIPSPSIRPNPSSGQVNLVKSEHPRSPVPYGRDLDQGGLCRPSSCPYIPGPSGYTPPSYPADPFRINDLTVFVNLGTLETMGGLELEFGAIPTTRIVSKSSQYLKLITNCSQQSQDLLRALIVVAFDHISTSTTLGSDRDK